MTGTGSDIIDALVDIAPGSRLDAIRALRPEARKQAQASHLALFEPTEPGAFSIQERLAVAAFIAGLHGEVETKDFYVAQAPPDLRQPIIAETASAGAVGPYGAYPAGPLSREDTTGRAYRVSGETRDILGPRLASAFEHIHMLVFHPRDADPSSLQALLDAGWTTTEVVTLSQLVAFLSFQIRVVSGLRTLAGQLQG